MTLKTTTLVTAAALSAVFLAGAPARADDLIDAKMIPGSFSANIYGVSEYFFRGLSQTDDKPAIQGGFDYSVDFGKSGLSGYLGIWGSNVDFNDGTTGASLESDFYGGIKGTIGSTGIGWDVGLIYYAYPGAANNLNYDFWEAKIALSKDWGPLATTVSYNYSPGFFGNADGDSGKAHYPKFQVDVPVGKYLTLSGYVARQTIEHNDRFAQPDYTEWNIKGAVKVAGFDVSLAWTDTNISNSDAAAGMVIFAVGRSF
jgi:uncharacterized protein (TIGR02001 family)